MWLDVGYSHSILLMQQHRPELRDTREHLETKQNTGCEATGVLCSLTVSPATVGGSVKSLGWYTFSSPVLKCLTRKQSSSNHKWRMRRDNVRLLSNLLSD